MATDEGDLNARIRGAVKAELARRDLSGNDLVEPLGIGRNAIYARLKGERPFDMNELERIAQYLSIELDVLWASADLAKAAA